MSDDESVGKSKEREPAPDESPFELAPIEGIPFDDDSEEARAIERVIRWDSEPDAASMRSD
jgi:hypothetical protein